MPDRRPGNSKLVYDKKTRSIVTEKTATPDESEALRHRSSQDKGT
jgi:hypothetical protein